MPIVYPRSWRRRLYRNLTAGLVLPLTVLCCGCPFGVPTTSDGATSSASNNSTDDSSLATANSVQLDSTGRVQFTNTIADGNDIDVYDLGILSPGDRIVADVQRTSGSLDPVAAVFNADQELVDFNDDRTPDGSNLNPLIDFIVRGTEGSYYLGIVAYPGSGGRGNYQVTVQITRSVGVPSPEGQVVFLEWRGGTNLVVPNVGVFNLPAFSATDVGFPASQSLTLKDRVQQIVKARYAGYNMTVLSSDHNAEPNTPHSIVYFGGNNLQAFAISQQIDSYNEDQTDKAIIFVEGFQGSFSHTPSFEEMAQAIGNTVAHELGHLLGLVHTADCSDMMDTSCDNDRILSAQSFSTAKLDTSVFPFGVQPEVDLLTWVLGLAGL